MSEAFSPLTLYLASANPGKLREFRQAASARGIAVEPVPNFTTLPLCVEDGSSFEENARKKAIHYSLFTQGLVFADDSGLCVDALRGRPGIRSARFAGPGASDEANNQMLLTELQLAEATAGEAPPNLTRGTRTASRLNRRAHYVCVIGLAKQARLLTVVEGRAEGIILEAPRGSGGFGYDPLFFFPPLGKTFAELSPQEKFTVSHRGEAFRKLLDYLATCCRPAF